mgnify:CR=1 FL=1
MREPLSVGRYPAAVTEASEQQRAEVGTHLGPPLGTPPPARRPYEWLLWLLGGTVLAVLMTWPLVRSLRTAVPQDTGDPLGQAWFVAWGGHGLLSQPTRLFTGNVFWPAESSYAHSDSLFGYAPAAWFGEGVTAAVIRYDLVFLLAYALAFAAAGLLARELGCHPAAAAVTAVAFAWAPWKMTHNGHLNVVSTAGVALALFLLVSGYRRGRAWQVVSGWAAAAWQMTLGFALGIWFAYFLLVLALISVAVWLRRRRPPLPRWLIASTVGGGLLYTAVTLFMVRPYLEIVANDPAALRDRSQLEFFSAPVRGLLAAGAESRAWGSATATIRETLPWAPEQVLFPGVCAVLLAAVGIRWRGATRGLRIGLVVATGFTVLLSFGLRLWGGALYEPFLLLPGWEGLRTTGRLAFLWSLGLALLAGFGAQRMRDALRTSEFLRARPGGSSGAVATAALVVVTGLAAYEGAPRLPIATVPQPPAALADAVGPRFHLPSDELSDTAYMLWSTDGFVPIANGGASYTPQRLRDLRAQTAGFPDPASLQALRDYGIETVVVHRDRLPGTPWDGAADRPVDGLGITRDDRGDVVLFDLTP